MTPVMKITEALVVLFLVLFCYLFLDKFLFRGELGEICFGPMHRALARWHRRCADRLDPPRRRARRTTAVPKDDALVVTRDYGTGQRTSARAASRHLRRKGNNSDKSDHTFVPASDGDKQHRAVQAAVQGWINKEPTTLTAEEENALAREAATEEVMDIGCETTALPAGTQSFTPQQLDCILALCSGQAVPEEQRQTLAGVLRDIRHTEVQRTLVDAISGASPIIARYLDDAEKEAAQRMAAAPK